jgi:predicted amidohydrolase/ribosomal protein S18 acetylase RimI-like enzyme
MTDAPAAPPTGTALDLASFEKPIHLRTMTEADVDRVIGLQLACFPGMRPWTRQQLLSHLNTFPEGQLVVEVDGKVVGSASSLILDFDAYEENHSFKDISGEGTIRNHDPDGKDLYGIEIMVHPDYRSMKIGGRLYQARKELCQRLGLKRILIAGRMPGYHAVADRMDPADYVEAVMRNEVDDQVLWFQLRNGFVPQHVLRNYLPGDKDSLGHAVLMEWSNIDYQVTPGRALKSSHPVRIAVIQYQMRKLESFEDFRRQTAYFVDVASNNKADFAVFPELLTTQLLSIAPERDPGKAVRHLATYTTQYLEHFRDLAVRFNVNIVGGSHIVEEAGRLRNVSFLFRRDGTIDGQAKLHITPNERRWWGIEPGEGLRVLDTDEGKIAILVCYDVEFPEMARVAVERGAKILFVPYCTEDRQGHLRVRYCAQARAVENQVYVVTAGTVGNLPEVENMDIQYAQSAVLTPSDFAFPRDGVAAEASPNVETVVMADVDLEVLRRNQRAGSVRQLQDRRKDLYQVTMRDGAGNPAADNPAAQRPPRPPLEGAHPDRPADRRASAPPSSDAV